MINYIALMECFKDTQRQIKKNPELAKRTKKMQAETRLYLENFTSMEPERKEKEPQIEVVEDTTFQCAGKYTGENKKIAVLNFANAYCPGGGVLEGAMAQEECLCRSSNLYEGLTIPYIVQHYYKWNQKNTDEMFSDRIIYTPGVTVFKDDSDYPKNRKEWFEVDVITCAVPYNAPQKQEQNAVEKLKSVFHHRIQNILEVAIANKVNILVLGAFGCGEFRNSPLLVANEMKKLLVHKEYATYFEKVVFAIKKSDENSNHLAFKVAFKDVGKSTGIGKFEDGKVIKTNFQVGRENQVLVWSASFGEDICTVSFQNTIGTTVSEVFILYDDLELYSEFDIRSTIIPGLSRKIVDVNENTVATLKWLGDGSYELTCGEDKVKIKMDKGAYAAYSGKKKMYTLDAHVGIYEINYLESLPKTLLCCLFAFQLMRFGF